MALKSFKDFQTEKSPRRIIFPVLAAIVVVTILGFLIFSSNQNQPEAVEFVAESAPTPSPEELRQIQISELRSELALAARAQNREKLEASALALLEVEPEDGEAWSHLGRVQESRGDTKEALASFTKAVEFSDQKAFNLYLRAKLLRAQGDLPSAVKDLEEAALADPSSVGISNSLMIFKIQNGGHDEIRFLVETYEKTGINRNAQFWLLGAAAIAMQDGNSVRASRCLEALKLTTSGPLFVEMLADTFFDSYRDEPGYREFFSRPPAPQ